MSEAFNALVECFTQIFNAPITWLIFSVATLVEIRNTFGKDFDEEKTKNEESSEGNTDDNESIRDQFITLMCKWEWGFKLMYKIGWARPGVDFFECGIDCSTCPKRDTCTGEDMNLEVKE